jgi:hypothetical protein
MKDITNKIKVLATLTCLVAIAAGCSHQEAPQTSGGVTAYSLLPQQQANTQFLKDLGSVPPDQRDAYIAAHSDAVDQLKSDPDKSKIDQFRSLLPQRTPQ